MGIRTEKGYYDLIIIGGGAAGLTAAISYGRAGGRDALILESEGFVGRKLPATGNGRCNLSNLLAPGYENTKAFFESLGILLTRDEAGRIYPLGRQASVVRDVLEEAARDSGAGIIVDCRAVGISTDPLSVTTKDGDVIRTGKLIVAAGGKSGPQYGSKGDGFAFARKFGHNVLSILPALAPLTYAEGVAAKFSSLKGVRAIGGLKLLTSEGEVIAGSEGGIQFTDFGVSGICAFDLSGALAKRKRQDPGVEFELRIDFAPSMSIDVLSSYLERESLAGLRGIMHAKIASLLESEIKSTGKSDGAFNDPCKKAAIVKGFPVIISGTRGWKESQVTSGGVELSEINLETMESKLFPGLYFAGEVLDYDGPSGGWNLDWAWNSGLIAGRSAAINVSGDA